MLQLDIYVLIISSALFKTTIRPLPSLAHFCVGGARGFYPAYTTLARQFGKRIICTSHSICSDFICFIIS